MQHQPREVAVEVEGGDHLSMEQTGTGVTGNIGLEEEEEEEEEEEVMEKEAVMEEETELEVGMEEEEEVVLEETQWLVSTCPTLMV